MQVDDLLGDAVGPAVDLCALFASLPGETVGAQQKSILGLENVLLSLVPEDAAELDKVGRVPNGLGNGCGASECACESTTRGLVLTVAPLLGAFLRRRREPIEESA
jgi:hypothetical protein